MVDFTTLKLVCNSYFNMCSSYELTNSSHRRSAYELTNSSLVETKHALSESRIAGIQVHISPERIFSAYMK